MEKRITHFGGQAGLCLAVGFGLMLVAHKAGPWLAAAAQWTLAIFLLRFARLTRLWRGYFCISAASAVVAFTTQIDVIPISLVGIALTALIGALISSCAYLADRLLAARLPLWAASLSFPAAAVALAYLGAQLSPFGTWGNPAYSAGLEGMVGPVAATGLWGETFLIAWVASAVNGAWGAGLRYGAPALIACLVTVLAGLIYAMRLSPPENTAQLVAGAVTPTRATPNVFRCKGDADCRSRSAEQRLDEIFDRSQEAVRQGAKLVLWSEGAAQILKSQEAAFLARARSFAARYDVYLFAGVTTIPDHYPVDLLENKLLAVSPHGIAWEYSKSKAVPGEPIVPGPGQVRVLDTPYGRIAAVICFDADFPSLVQQAGRAQSDILLVSANDWPAIARTHADMAVFRAVENGVSLVRASNKGQSLFTTRTGRVIARRDTSSPGGALLVETVPAQGYATAYRSVGDMFAWLCLGSVALAGLWALRFRARQR